MPIDAAHYRSPGQFIRALLDERHWTIRTLAIVLQMGETSLNRVVADKQPVTVEMALTMSDVFGIPAERFLELQQAYDLAKARIIAIPDPGLETRAQLFGALPIAEMIKRGWLAVDDIKDVAAVETALAKFFGVDSPAEIEVLPHAAKKTHANVPATPAQLAWLRRVRQIAREMVAPPYNRFAMRGTLERLRVLTSAAEESRKVPRILTEAGIRYVVVEALPNSKIDGVCFWLNDAAPVIGMSLRHDRIDNFWFVLRHEIEHVMQEHGKSAVMLDADLESEIASDPRSIANEEKLANLAASEFCVPKKAMDSFIARKEPLFAERDLLGLAATLKVHPGLVAGQLQHRTKRYDRFRNHLVKIRSIIAPSAVVDGWGDIAPVR